LSSTGKVVSFLTTRAFQWGPGGRFSTNEFWGLGGEMGWPKRDLKKFEQTKVTMVPSGKQIGQDGPRELSHQSCKYH